MQRELNSASTKSDMQLSFLLCLTSAVSASAAGNQLFLLDKRKTKLAGTTQSNIAS